MKRIEWLGKKRTALLVVIVAGALVSAAALLAQFIVWGGSVARGTEPWEVEGKLAQGLLHQSVPPAARRLKSPLDPADVSAVSMGRALYRQKCEVCHAYDGSGKTDIGSGEYPHPRDLRGPEVQELSDGELFYHVQNGIRHTGMPGWGMADAQLWQLVAYLRRLPRVASFEPPTSAGGYPAPDKGARYVGSAACKECHEEIYTRWSKTRMANVVRDPKIHPDAILPDLSKPDPLVRFSKADIAFVYGSKWKQRYFTKRGDDYFPLPAQWDVTHKLWRPYFVQDGTDWWATLYPPDDLKRPTGPLCDGCHSVNYNTSTKRVTEWNVGCERCHGPGEEHVKKEGHGPIVNPARLDYVQANDVCIQCHSQGRPLRNPIDGKYYDWPVGFHVGGRLSEFWKLEEHRLGETSFTHFADGTGHKNRMQGNDFVQSLMYTRGVTCFSCHDAHGTEENALLWKPANAICLDCHGPKSQNGPHAASIEQHTHHRPDSAGSECVGCHMPKIEQTIADVNVRAHTFRFITPAKSEALAVPNACNLCHADRTAAWASDALRGWSDRSPWRMAE